MPHAAAEENFATIADAGPPTPEAAAQLTATLVDAAWLSGPVDPEVDPLAETHLGDSARPLSQSDLQRLLRTTILPRVARVGEGDALVVEDRVRYEPVAALGQGAMGEVVLIRDNDIRRKVAMKRLKVHQPAQVARFVDEIRTVGRLEHPNIIPIHDVGVDEKGALFFVMKLVEGETLEEIIAKLAAGDPEAHRRYTFEVRTQIFLGVLRAVQYAHAQGVIHRDLKPANIMIGPYGEAMVMDWGLARILEEDDAIAQGAAPDLNQTLVQVGGPEEGNERLFQTQAGTLLGTPAYMSPEQALGDTASIDTRSDIYALSVIYHELMGLQHYLHDRTNLQGMLMGAVHAKAPFVSFVSSPHQGRVAPEVAHFIAKGMAKEPAARYQSVDEMIQALQRVLDGTFAVQCPMTFVRRVLSQILRTTNAHPVAVLLTLLIILVGFGAGVAWGLGTLFG